MSHIHIHGWVVTVQGWGTYIYVIGKQRVNNLTIIMTGFNLFFVWDIVVASLII